ncbi:Hcp family type VI secretion system effector [Pectobacterium carotovorum]|uniref:Hcp family type VI secretion system effector n=1 Tax=Pectobacterium carotovorum TaxID=554 RepID=UPI0030197429
MANYAYMTIEGKSQGLISEGCSTLESISNRYQVGHTDEIMILAFNHMMSNDGHAVHNPITLVKPIDKSTPLLAMALNEQEKVKVLLDFYRTTQHAKQEKFFSIQINDGLISDINLVMPNIIDDGAGLILEHISIRYKDVTWTHHKAGTSGYALWEMTKFMN